MTKAPRLHNERRRDSRLSLTRAQMRLGRNVTFTAGPGALTLDTERG
jgi:hypothetical protein